MGNSAVSAKIMLSQNGLLSPRKFKGYLLVRAFLKEVTK